MASPLDESVLGSPPPVQPVNAPAPPVAPPPGAPAPVGTKMASGEIERPGTVVAVPTPAGQPPKTMVAAPMVDGQPAGTIVAAPVAPQSGNVTGPAAVVAVIPWYRSVEVWIAVIGVVCTLIDQISPFLTPKQRGFLAATGAALLGVRRIVSNRIVGTPNG